MGVLELEAILAMAKAAITLEAMLGLVMVGVVNNILWQIIILFYQSQYWLGALF